MGFRALFKLMRIHQYIKNFFIFAPIFFAFSFDWAVVRECLLVFACFSLIASAVYIFNDYQDRESDALHPSKKHRPLASGQITPRVALYFAFILVCLGGGGE